MKKYTQKEFDNFEIIDRIKQCPSGDYSNVNLNGEWCSFGERCSFGEECKFLTIGIFILFSSLGNVSDKLCLELMRRDASMHNNPEMFDKWANGDGSCPYYNSRWLRTHYFNESRKLWKAGKPEMTDKELVLEIMKEKKWEVVSK